MFEDKIAVMNGNLKDITSGETYEKRVYTVDEIIDILGIGKNAAYNLVSSGVFHSVKIGGHYRISKKSFDQWLDNSNCQGCEE